MIQRFLFFYVGGIYFCLDLQKVEEIFEKKSSKILSLSDEPAHVKGKVIKKHRHIKVFDLLKKLNLGETEFPDNIEILLTNTENGMFGLVIDGFVGIVDKYTENIRSEENSGVKFCGKPSLEFIKHMDKKVYLIHPEEFFDQDEITLQKKAG